MESFSKSNCWTLRRILGLTTPPLRRKALPWGVFITAEGPQTGHADCSVPLSDVVYTKVIF